MTRVAAALVIVLFFGGASPTQEQPPPSDPHGGQPETCTNVPNKEAQVKDCPCKKSCEQNAPEDRKCRVYCRKPMCRCDHGCETE